jgi:hypothetical protein
MHKGQQVLLEGSIAAFVSPGVPADVAADRLGNETSFQSFAQK